MTQAATDKQINLILTLAGKIEGKRFYDLRGASHLFTTSWRNLDKAGASLIIDELQNRLNKPAADANDAADLTAAPEYGLEAAVAVSLLGKTITLTTISGKTATGVATTIELRDGNPAIRVAGATWTLSRITSWKIVG